MGEKIKQGRQNCVESLNSGKRLRKSFRENAAIVLVTLGVLNTRAELNFCVPENPS